METMHAAGRRRLPPVPRPVPDRSAPGQVALAVQDPVPDTDEFETQVIDTQQIAAELVEAELAALADAAETAEEPALDVTQKLEPAELEALLAEDVEDVEDVDAADDEDPHEEVEPELLPEPAVDEQQDPAQLFVARLRSSATDFATAAGAESAVVREAVPPARHRRARCRLVLRYADGATTDVTLLGPAGAPGRPSRRGFDRQILRWLGAGLAEDAAWLVEDPDAPDGIAVDLTAWVAAG